jgi:hypothetical protein
LNLGAPEYEARMLIIQPRRSDLLIVEAG